jgi:hypothetical protein
MTVKIEERFFGELVCGRCLRFDPPHPPGECSVEDPLSADVESRLIREAWDAERVVAAGGDPRRELDVRYRHEPGRGWFVDESAAWDYAAVPGLSEAEAEACRSRTSDVSLGGCEHPVARSDDGDGEPSYF